MSDKPDKELDREELMDAAKKGGMKVISGISKGGMAFTKRVAEGTIKAQVAQQSKGEATEKFIAAGAEIGKSLVKGMIEGATETVGGIVEGVNTMADEIRKTKSSHDD